MLLELVLAGVNLLVINLQKCIAPCVLDDPTKCVIPSGAKQTCDHYLVESIAICTFGIFFPLFLFCLPCYLGSGIHIQNLQNQLQEKNKFLSEREQQRGQNEESKY